MSEVVTLKEVNGLDAVCLDMGEKAAEEGYFVSVIEKQGGAIARVVYDPAIADRSIMIEVDFVRIEDSYRVVVFCHELGHVLHIAQDKIFCGMIEANGLCGIVRLFLHRLCYQKQVSSHVSTEILEKGFNVEFEKIKDVPWQPGKTMGFVDLLLSNYSPEQCVFETGNIVNGRAASVASGIVDIVYEKEISPENLGEQFEKLRDYLIEQHVLTRDAIGNWQIVKYWQ